jgi:hypothetical protein
MMMAQARSLLMTGPAQGITKDVWAVGLEPTLPMTNGRLPRSSKWIEEDWNQIGFPPGIRAFEDLTGKLIADRIQENPCTRGNIIDGMEPGT